MGFIDSNDFEKIQRRSKHIHVDIMKSYTWGNAWGMPGELMPSHYFVAQKPLTTGFQDFFTEEFRSTIEL